MDTPFENFILDENAKIADTANKETLLTIIDKAYRTF